MRCARCGTVARSPSSDSHSDGGQDRPARRGLDARRVNDNSGSTHPLQKLRSYRRTCFRDRPRRLSATECLHDALGKWRAWSRPRSATGPSGRRRSMASHATSATISSARLLRECSLQFAVVRRPRHGLTSGGARASSRYRCRRSGRLRRGRRHGRRPSR